MPAFQCPPGQSRRFAAQHTPRCSMPFHQLDVLAARRPSGHSLPPWLPDALLAARCPLSHLALFWLFSALLASGRTSSHSVLPLLHEALLTTCYHFIRQRHSRSFGVLAVHLVTLSHLVSCCPPWSAPATQSPPCCSAHSLPPGTDLATRRPLGRPGTPLCSTPSQ